MDPAPLPWNEREITAILPHRSPFLFVDRVTEFEPERRIVGERTWSAAEAIITTPDHGQAVPAAYLTECMAQVGALLVLSRPENRGQIIFFLGIDRARFRSPVGPGETLQVEAVVRRLRTRMGSLYGSARVGDRLVAEGSMTFALAANGRPEAGE